MPLLNRLNALQVKNLKVEGLYEDGGGLRLIVAPRTKRWVMRLTIAGKRVERGLGSYPLVTLEAARIEAGKMRLAASKDIDLREERKQKAMAQMSFRDMFAVTLALREKQLSNSKHLKQWTSTMEAYVFPKIGNVPVAEVTTSQVISVLTPIWYEKAETAKRILQRMELVFKSAIVRGARKTASPCVGVAAELGTKHRSPGHHASMPWREVPAFLKKLREEPPGRRWPVTSLGLEFMILTATRSGETRGAAWTEFDLTSKTWTIPKERMKARQPHRVPLSARCLEILEAARVLNPESALVFPNRFRKPLSDMTFTKLLRDEGYDATAHGFRSSFKVWASECAKVPNEVSEAALAHSLGNKIVAAYLRTDFLEERRALMEQWAATA